MKNTYLIKERSPELILSELKEEVRARISEFLNLVKDIRATESENLRARCALFAYEDVYNVILALEAEEEVERELDE